MRLSFAVMISRVLEMELSKDEVPRKQIHTADALSRAVMHFLAVVFLSAVVLQLLFDIKSTWMEKQSFGSSAFTD